MPPAIIDHGAEKQRQAMSSRRTLLQSVFSQDERVRGSYYDTRPFGYAEHPLGRLFDKRIVTSTQPLFKQQYIVIERVATENRSRMNHAEE